MNYLWVGLGGAFGTITRYWLSGWINDRYGPTPWAIFVVNVTGALLIGFITTVFQDRFIVSPDARRFITIGVLGGYTTFSTFMYETMQLIETGDFVRAAINSFGSVALGLLAVYLGIVLGRLA